MLEQQVKYMRALQAGATKSLFDEMIDRHAEAYLEAYPEVKEFSAYEKSGTGNYYIGMIWCSDFEKPDTKQIKLRGSSSMTNNKMIELDLSAIDSQQCFFPGQIIAFFGDPFLSQRLTIRKLLDPMRIVPKMKTINTDESISLLIASGPFMKPEEEDWYLFNKMIEQIKEVNATHVLLLGPFVDMENKKLRGNHESHWKYCFEKLIEGLIDLSCTVYMVPSSRDILPSHLSATYFYPSPKFTHDIKLRDGLEAKCKIVTVTDPTQIDLGGIYLDTTSAEVMFHLNRCSSFINKGGSTFNSMFRHLLAHGIYPIYPPPSDMPIDYPKLAKYLQLDRLGPHILVLPSRFNTSINNVDNRLVVTVQKCSTKKQVIHIEIPKIESSVEAPVDSIVITDYKYKEINLVEPTIKEEITSSELTEKCSKEEKPMIVTEEICSS